MQAISDDVAVPSPAPSTLSPGDSQALAPIVAFLTGAPGPAASLPWQSLRRQDIAVVRAWILGYYPAYLAPRLLGALKQATTAAVGDWREDAPGRHSFRLPRARPLRFTRRVAPREIVVLIEPCSRDSEAVGKRDAAVIGLLAGAGLTPGEVAKVTLASYDDTEHSISPPRRRGVPWRSVVLTEDVSNLLDGWLEARGRGGGALFLADYKAEIREGQPLGPAAIRSMLRRRSLEAGASMISAADLRCAFTAALREEQRRSPYAAIARFAVSEDGEAGMVLPGLALGVQAAAD
jgi:integrase